MRVAIDDLNDDGRGRGHAEARTVLVSQALPGDVVEVRIDRSSRITVQGRVRETIEVGPHRARHPCPHEDRCTGCPLLRATERLENNFKFERLNRWIERVDPGLLEHVRPMERPSALFHYRHYAKQVVTEDRGELVFGSYVSGTHVVADNAGCPVLAPDVAALLEEVRQRLNGLPAHGDGQPGVRYVVVRQSRATGELLLVVVCSSDVSAIATRLDGLSDRIARYALRNRGTGNRILQGDLVHLGGGTAIVERLLGYDHLVGPMSFFQVNPVAAERLFTVALEAAGRGARVVEGYAGVGVLTLPLTDRFQRVAANELNAESVALLRGRAPSVDVRLGRAEAVLPELLREPCDAVVLDPPRKGLGEAVARAVARAAPDRVVLLSCDPSSLVRDLPILLESHRVAAIVPIDQFPRTAHFETVTVLRAR